ncbi:MAG: hypothetical protein ACP5TF_02075 [Candidatus Acidifodinimicrobium sp.]
MFGNWYGWNGPGFRGGFGAGRRMRQMNDLTGLDYDLLYILSDHSLNAEELFEQLKNFRVNTSFPILGCINLHLKHLTDEGYLERHEQDGKTYYSLTSKGKELIW